eukprot:TRINITY_DN20189_c0_g1_i1.p1 TRINITY_DN20189_c0_g1~~TRINITY_DN20189_c0_g1_i1.p1  ORF type:complete len:827 (-),score=185.94 TRINITY_DN20189_c0_g1_i1:61-2484(-)
MLPHARCVAELTRSAAVRELRWLRLSVAALALLANFARPAAGESGAAVDINGVGAAELYWATSHSLAVSVPATKSEDSADAGQKGAATLKFASIHGPWLWLVAVPKGKDDSESKTSLTAWIEMREAFHHQITANERLMIESLAALPDVDDFHVPDPKVQTVRLQLEGEADVFIRAAPAIKCVQDLSPPRESFLPSVLPPVPEGRCILELANLEADVEYEVSMYVFKHGSQIPEEVQDSACSKTFKTLELNNHIRYTLLTLQVGSFVAMAFGLLVQIVSIMRSSKEGEKKSSEMELVGDEMGLLESISSEAAMNGVSGQHENMMRRTASSVIQDVLLALTMFLPLVGPIGLALSSHVVLGVRMQKLSRAYSEKGLLSLVSCYRLCSVIVTLVLVPWSVWQAQKIWMIYFHHVYDSIGLNFVGDSDVRSFRIRYALSLQVSGVEMTAWIPAIALSTFLLAVESHSEVIAEQVRSIKGRAERRIKSTPQGTRLYAQLCSLDGSSFADTGDSGAAVKGAGMESRDGITPAVVIGSILFSLVPHFWMCGRHGVSVWNGPMMQWTLLYVLNVSGMCIRFFGHMNVCLGTYERQCEMFAIFQALSWQEDGSRDLFDPFTTLNDRVLAARARLKGEIVPLKLELIADSQVWWSMRELLLIELREGKVIAETLVLLSILLAAGAGMSSFFVAQSLEEVTSITICTAVATVGLLIFVRLALGRARDINLMSQEHLRLLHGVVAQMASKAPRSFETQLRQERFLLQLATLIEKTPGPESVASFQVTPEIASGATGILAVLAALAVWNLCRGMAHLQSA